MVFYCLVVALVTLVVSVQGHVCMWAPMQRKGVSIATPGESLCYLKEGPCGGVPSASPLTTLQGGQDFTIYFQQNLNHYYIEDPGRLVADFASKADPNEEDFVPLGSPIADYNALNEITQTNFTMKVTIPNGDIEHGVVRLRYISQNPTENDRGMTFYQCADVKVIATPTTHLRSKESPSLPTNNDKSRECCAPPQFTLEGYESNSWRANTVKKYYFDAVNRLFRVDTNSGTGVTPKDGHFQMISNFTSGIEYYYNVHENTCLLFGLNYWSDWCFGSVNQQTLKQSTKLGDQVLHEWIQPSTPFHWTNFEKGCRPFTMFREDTGETTVFSNMVVGAPDPSVFTIPAACKRREEMLKGTSALPKAPKDHSIHPIH